jgi:aldehyde dehydrogenase (NAD+)
MKRYGQFYIGGEWVSARSSDWADVINPASETPVAAIAMGGAEDVAHAVAAARQAFPGFAQSSRAQRRDLLRAIDAQYQRRADDLASAVHAEMGAPAGFARDAQVAIGGAHIAKMIEVLESYQFEQDQGSYRVRREPIGVCGLITPWNWPLNQIACKVVPALAAGCTMVLKPSELAPLSALLFAEILAAAGVPAGVFNLVNGDGPTVGAALSTHPDVDLISFTGSTRAGIAVAQAAAPTVKRVHQELGGKSANIILPDADLESAVASGVAGCFLNAGQSCNAPTRMLVQRGAMDQAAQFAARAAQAFTSAPSGSDGNAKLLGPMVSRTQFDKVQALIQAGIDEGARLVTGGPGRPDGVATGYFIRPTVFADVQPEMRIAREEIFGPVLSMLAYDDVDDAVSIANDTEYGLSGYVSGSDLQAAGAVAERLRAGTIFINHPEWTPAVPFGGYKRSGNGREYAQYGLEDFLELKGIVARAA